jgi:hypothetical protein
MELTEINGLIRKGGKNKMKKEWMYEYRNEHERPVVTVCLTKAGKQFARGIALCSKLDHIDSNKGAIKARGRAIKAATRKAPDLPINRDEAIRILFEADAPPFKYKAEFPAKLTALEQKLLEVV